MWSDSRIIELAKEFVPATDEVWRLQRGTGPECRHFQKLADQGHYRAPGGTRQGIYVGTAGGELLASINSLSADAVLATMRAGLEAWKALPAEDRALPPDLDFAPAHRWEDSYPSGGLVLELTNRDVPTAPGAKEELSSRTNIDHVWFSAAEAREWVPEDPAPGASTLLPAPLANRLICLHLVDSVKGQPMPFAPASVTDRTIRTLVVARDGDLIRLHIVGHTRADSDGVWKLGENDFTTPRGQEFPRAVETTLLGSAEFDVSRGAFTAFELVAVGRRWGRGWLNARAAGSEGGLGFVLRLAPDTPPARIAPAFAGLYRRFAASWVQPPPEK